jgi:hypothetical protein
MANLTLRTVKGTFLEFAEVDSNFSSINNELPDTLLYDSATSLLTMGRIGTASLVGDFSPITNALPDTLVFDPITKIVSLGRVGNADITVDLSPLTERVDIVTTATGLTMGLGLFYHLTNSSQTMTLPTGVSGGERCELSVRNFTNTTVARNGNKIMGLAEDMTLDYAYATTKFTFIDSAYGWSVHV